MKTFELHELKVVRKNLGKNVTDLDKLMEDIQVALLIDNIQLPITRDSFRALCHSLKRECTRQQATEAVLESRGPSLEQSPDFNKKSLVKYLHKTLRFMPPVGKPRELIE